MNAGQSAYTPDWIRRWQLTSACSSYGKVDDVELVLDGVLDAANLSFNRGSRYSWSISIWYKGFAHCTASFADNTSHALSIPQPKHSSRNMCTVTA